MRKSTTLAIATLMLIVAACTPGVDVAAPTSVANEPDLVSASAAMALAPFDDCAALLAHFKSEAQERVGPYGLESGPIYYFEDMAADMAVEEMAAPADAAATSAGGFSSDDFTTTNTQEVGIDEPDIVKTDGERILALSENTLTLVDLTGAEPVATDSITLETGWSNELFFAGDRAFLIANGGYEQVMPVDDLLSDSIAPAGYGPVAVIHEVDLSDPSNLQIAATLVIEGRYLSARAIGDQIRLAVTSPPNQLPFVYPQNPNGEDRAEEFNREVIADSTIEDWLPGYSLTIGDTSSEGQLIDCGRVFRPEEFSGFDVLSVLTIDLSSGLDIGSGTGVVAAGETVYASQDRFYVATSRWIAPEVDDTGRAIVPRFTDDYTTSIHAFDNTGAEAEYVASGEVKGSLLNQFSLDESGGYLRVVTTDGSPWDERDQSETFLTVLEERGDRLEEVGVVGGLGKGESLYSARLLDDVGFAVTFRQIDPFYVLDLSDPTNPTVSGELKLPGVSTYLHPLGDHRVLGIGRDATEDGAVTGFKVSLFSVADPSSPVELANWTVDNAESPAEYDHRAFTYLPERNIAVLPLRSWNNTELNGAVLLEIGDASITELGRVSHVKPDQAPTSECTELTADDFPSEQSELHYMTAEEYGHVQVCEPGQDPGYGSYYCDPIPLEQLDQNWGVPSDEVDALQSRFDPNSTIEICWPDEGDWRRQIQRSLVIGDNLWTLSIDSLQANSLGDLSEVASVEL